MVDHFHGEFRSGSVRSILARFSWIFGENENPVDSGWNPGDGDPESIDVVVRRQRVRRAAGIPPGGYRRLYRATRISPVGGCRAFSPGFARRAVDDDFEEGVLTGCEDLVVRRYIEPVEVPVLLSQAVDLLSGGPPGRRRSPSRRRSPASGKGRLPSGFRRGCPKFTVASAMVVFLLKRATVSFGS